MKRGVPTLKIIVLLLGLLMSTSCMGTWKSELCGTAVPPTLEPLPAEVALVSFHGRYVTAMGAGGGWLLTQQQELSDCGLFTLCYLDDGKVALMTCHDRYVTAPETGATRSDWRLWQESELTDCGQFVLYDLRGYGFALETCAFNVITAGDGGWPENLAWAIVGETPDVKDWERFEMLRPYTPLQVMIANFGSCNGLTRLGGQMGVAYDPSSGDMAAVSYVQQEGGGCFAKLDYNLAARPDGASGGWVGFWIRLQGADLSPYSRLVFDVKADSQENVPEQIKIELKRGGRQETAILSSGITTDWQTMAVSLSDFEGSLSSLTDIEELVFVFEFEASESERKTGAIYLDDIGLQRGPGVQ